MLMKFMTMFLSSCLSLQKTNVNSKRSLQLSLLLLNVRMVNTLMEENVIIAQKESRTVLSALSITPCLFKLSVQLVIKGSH